MELIELKNRIIDSFEGTQSELEEILNLIKADKSIFPFNEYEYMICNMLHTGKLSYDKYLEIRQEYIDANPYLGVFEISAPRGFGEKFVQTYVQNIAPLLQKPSKKLDANYSGQYDLWLDGIRVEVKASRAVDSESDEPLYIKALSGNTKSSFLMNFQQLKPQMCDVFIWVAVFRDEIILWVLSANEVLHHKLYSKGQHWGNKGNEGQLHITDENIRDFDMFKVQNDQLETAVREAYKRQCV